MSLGVFRRWSYEQGEVRLIGMHKNLPLRDTQKAASNDRPFLDE